MLQALLFSLFGAVFLFASAKMKVRKLILWLFGFSAMIHTTGLTARGHYPVLDNVLIANSIVMLLLIGYMCYRIYVAFGRKRPTGSRTAARS